MSLFNRKKKFEKRETDKNIACKPAMINAASTLLANIQFSSVDKPHKTIVITSSEPNEGKSTTALSLAAAIGASGMSCVLLECDMRRRSLSGALGVRPKHFLYEVLKGKVNAKEAIVDAGIEGVFLLDAEPNIPNPDALLRSESFGKMLEALSAEYDYVVIDTPPVLAYPDASVAASLADATLLVCLEGSTQKKAAQLSVEQLKTAGANLVGVVFKATTYSGGGYGYGYGYGYAEAADSKSGTSQG